MQSVPEVQEAGFGQPTPCQSDIWTEEEPSPADSSNVLPAVPVLLQVLPERVGVCLRWLQQLLKVEALVMC